MNVLRRHRQADENCGFECPSPRRIFSRLFRRSTDRRSPVCCKDGKESVDDKSACLCSPLSGAKGCRQHVGSSVGTAESDESGPCGNGNMFNLGVTCSLLYLLASTKDELSKMKELRTNMEMLLQNAKEYSSTDTVSETLVLKESPSASCLTNLKGVSSCSSHLSCRSFTAPFLLQGEQSIPISSQSIECDESKKESMEGMEQLEAELEAELERLQLQLDTESFAQSIKINGSTLERSSNLSPGEVIDPIEASIQIHGGVPPIELERKLHALLESRQEERIKELEAALGHLNRKLSKKQREATWWKDTALLMSCHIPETLDRC